MWLAHINFAFLYGILIEDRTRARTIFDIVTISITSDIPVYIIFIMVLLPHIIYYYCFWCYCCWWCCCSSLWFAYLYGSTSVVAYLTRDDRESSTHFQWFGAIHIRYVRCIIRILCLLQQTKYSQTWKFIIKTQFSLAFVLFFFFYYALIFIACSIKQ